MDPAANPTIQLVTNATLEERNDLSKQNSAVSQSLIQPAAPDEQTNYTYNTILQEKDRPVTVIRDDHEPEDALGAFHPDDNFPEGGLRAWSVLIGSVCGLFASFGFMVSIGTLQDYWHEHQLSEYNLRDVGWIPSVFVYLALGLGIWVGPLFDRYGPRWLMLSGGVSYVIMMFVLAECTQFWQIMLCLGVWGGISAALMQTTSLAVISHWFKRRRGMAAGLAMIGSSLGGMTIPLILRVALPKYGYAWAIRILGFLCLACVVIANLLVKPRLKPSPEVRRQKILSLRMFGRVDFSFLTVTVFGIEIVLFGALGILPTYANYGNNYPADTGFYLITVMNAFSCFGRFLPGLASDYIGRFNVLMIMITTTLVFMLVLWLPFGHRNLTVLYVFVAFFGFGTGAWMALTPACIGQLVDAENFGRGYGTLYFVASLATLVCIPITGELVDAVGPQIMVGFMCGILGMSLVAFMISRWACLGYKWKWFVKV